MLVPFIASTSIYDPVFYMQYPLYLTGLAQPLVWASLASFDLLLPQVQYNTCSSLNILVICLLAFRPIHFLPFSYSVSKETDSCQLHLLNSLACSPNKLRQWKIKRKSRSMGRRRGDTNVFHPLCDSGSFSHSFSSMIPILGPARDSGSKGLLLQLLCLSLQP